MKKSELKAFQEYQFVWNTRERTYNWKTKTLDIETVGHIEILMLVKITNDFYEVYDKHKNKRFRIKIQNVLDIELPSKV